METKKLIINNKIEQLDIVQRFLEQLGIEWGLDDELVFQLNLMIEEYVSNLICYGYSDQLDHEIELEISVEDRQVKIVITDDGNTFNIMELPDSDEIEKPLNERKIGGLGIHFIKSLADQIEYSSAEGRNKLFLVKYLKPG